MLELPNIPDPLKSLSDRERVDPEQHGRLQKEAAKYISHLSWKMGLHAAARYPDFPNSEEEFRSGVTTGTAESEAFADLAAPMVSDEVRRLLQREYCRSLDPLSWDEQTFHDSLEQRIAFSYLVQTGFLAQYREGLIPGHRLVDYILSPNLSPDDFFRADCIHENEFEELQKRFGSAVILESLAAGDPRKTALTLQRDHLLERLSQHPTSERLDLRSLERVDPGSVELARELYRTLAQALRQLGLDRFRALDVQQEAFALLVESGKEEAESFLKTHFPQPKQRERVFRDLCRRLNEYTGQELSISSSRFEDDVSDWLQERGIKARRHPLYREVDGFTTTRNFRADFVIGDRSSGVLIEIVSLEDEFIHNDDYRARLQQKRALAHSAGWSYMELCEFDFCALERILDPFVHWDRFPDEIYDREPKALPPAISPGSAKQHRVLLPPKPRSKYPFCTNPYVLAAERAA